jgi:hypothetical protein
MGGFLATWGKALAGRVTILSYEQIFSRLPAALPPGTYIFTCLGRSLGSRNPPSRSRQLVSQLRSELANRYGPGCALNDPASSLNRIELLHLLSKRGINAFGIYRAGEIPEPGHFPVFLRPASGSQWQPLPLLQDREEYRQALAQAPSLDDQIVIEFCDTRDHLGIYRKYGAFVIGDRIVPRHLFFSREWLVKSADLTGPDQLAEEMAYLESNPHADVLLDACRLAHIGYGRIDYAVRDGRVQIWEINTTPTIFNPPGPDDAVRARAHEHFVAAFAAALNAIDPDRHQPLSTALDGKR